MNRKLFLGAALVGVMLAAGCRQGSQSAPRATSEDLKVGLVASMTGELKPWGADSARGAQLAVKEFNEAGGLNGKQVRLMIEDSNSKAETGKNAAEKLVADGAMGLLGEVASGITNTVASVAVSNGLPLIAIGATRDDITELGPNLFRVCYVDSFQGPVMAKFAYDELGLRRVAIMTDKKQPYSTFLSESFAKAFKKYGGEIVAQEFYETKQTQFSSQLTNIRTKAPEGLFLSGYFTEVGSIVRQAAQLGMGNLKFLGGDGWDSVELQASGGEAILGGYFCNHYNSKEDRPEIKSFLANWQKEYGSPPGTTMAALGYDAAKLMLDAMKRAAADGELTSKTLAAKIEDTVDFEGVSGKITLKGMKGNPPKRALVVKVVKPTAENPTGQEFAKSYEHDEIE